MGRRIMPKPSRNSTVAQYTGLADVFPAIVWRARVCARNANARERPPPRSSDAGQLAPWLRPWMAPDTFSMDSGRCARKSELRPRISLPMPLQTHAREWRWGMSAAKCLSACCQLRQAFNAKSARADHDRGSVPRSGGRRLRYHFAEHPGAQLL